jgi:hypothetical protein
LIQLRGSRGKMEGRREGKWKEVRGDGEEGEGRRDEGE